MTESAARAPALPPVWQRHPLGWFVVKRSAAGFITLLAVSILIFAITELLPGDPAGAILGRNATPENLAEVRALMGLDRPAPERYLDWLGGLLTGDLGNSSAGYAQGGEISIWDDIKGPLGTRSSSPRSPP